MNNRHLAFSYHSSEEIDKGLYYCKDLDLYWKAGITYCPLSASHNGLIGAGAKLKKVNKALLLNEKVV